MNRTNHEDESDADVQAPQELADDLAAAFGSDVSVPPEVDAAVLARARRHFARRRRPRRLVRCLAAAAAVAVVALTLHLVTREQPIAKIKHTAQKAAASEASMEAPPAVARKSVREDIDLDGRVDILDAFALARHLKAGEARRREWDITDDGEVNDADVRVVALAAVDLRRGTFQ